MNKSVSVVNRFAIACCVVLAGWMAALPAHSEVSLPNGEYREEIEDLRVQVLGGPIRVTRD